MPATVLVGTTLLGFALVALTLELPAEEDAFIYYRYAWQWAHGRGLAFNPGQPVEGFSSPLWMGALALIAWAGLDLPATAPVLGLTCGAATLVATWWLGAAIGLGWWARAAALFTLALSLPFVAWSRSGLETPLYSLAIVVTLAAYLGAQYPSRGACRVPRWAAPLGLIALCLGRPEGVLPAMVPVGDRLIDRDWKGVLRYGLPVVATVGVLLAWRAWLFHALALNTAVKLYTPLIARSSEQALTYVLYLGVIPLALPLLALGRGERRRPGVLLAAVVFSFVFHFVAGGDYRRGGDT